MDQSFDYFPIEILLLVTLLPIFVKCFWSSHFLLPQWVICLHTTLGIPKGGIILALLVAALLRLRYCFQQSLPQGTTVIRYCWSSLWQNSHTVIIILNIFPLSFLLHEYPPSMSLCPFLKSCIVAFGMILMLAQKLHSIFNQLF